MADITIRSRDVMFQQHESKNVDISRSGLSPIKLLLQAYAENHCKYLAQNGLFKHSKNRPFGENLYKATSNKRISRQRFKQSGHRASKRWYLEILEYDYDNPVFKKKTGHFTQVYR